MFENVNSIELIGTISSSPEYSHSICGEAFYRTELAVKRLSGTEDFIPVTVSERLLGSLEAECGMRFYIRGQIRSYNQRSERGNRLIITVFARSIRPADETENDRNEAELSGYICKDVIYRTTPFEREIADILLAVNRRYNKSDYLPLIAWGRNARFLSEAPVGTELSVTGRLQSREYKKQLEDGTEQIRIAYEVSCSAVEAGI
ncbi:MAG: single-stranded DNA-binding protein [Clostridia bacterium]|nr:single-stranded DNA-binding protein [Clostridia bacterium]